METELTKEKKTGFSLIEVIFAFVIIFSLLLGTAETLLVSLSSKNTTDQRLGMTHLLFSKAEYLKSEQFKTSSLPEGLHMDKVQNPSNEEVYLLNWNTQSLSSNLWCIEMSCRMEENPEREIRLCLYILKSLRF